MGLCVEGRKIPRTICNWGKGCGEDFLSSSVKWLGVSIAHV